MKALVLNSTLKRAPEPSNTEALARVVMSALEQQGVQTELLRVLDYNVMPGVLSDEGDGDEWPQLREKIVACDVLIIATPTWLGGPSSVSKRVLERMDAMLSEQDEEGRPVAYNKVAGVVVTGNEDGARAPRHQRDFGRTFGHRLHRSGAGLDLLEQGAGAG